MREAKWRSSENWQAAQTFPERKTDSVIEADSPQGRFSYAQASGLGSPLESFFSVQVSPRGQEPWMLENTEPHSWARLGAASRTAVAQANEWTWMGGSNAIDRLPPNGNCGEAGAEGMLGVRAAANIPGGRYGAATWTDKEGNFWIFGGDSNSSGSDDQNDLK